LTLSAARISAAASRLPRPKTSSYRRLASALWWSIGVMPRILGDLLVTCQGIAVRQEMGSILTYRPTRAGGSGSGDRAKRRGWACELGEVPIRDQLRIHQGATDAQAPGAYGGSRREPPVGHQRQHHPAAAANVGAIDAVAADRIATATGSSASRASRS